MHDCVVILPNSEPISEIQDSIVGNVFWQMDMDRKIASLKSFQGYMWRSAYESGQIKGAVYPDVKEAFKRWKESGKSVHIYSSGSVEAQKLLFKYSSDGDLTRVSSRELRLMSP